MRSIIICLSLLLATGVQAQTRIDWEKSYGGSDWDQGNAVRQTTDGGFVTAGYSKSGNGDVGGNHGGEDVWVIKTDADGNLQWSHYFGGTGSDQAEDIRQTTDGGYIVAGHTTSTNGDVAGNNGNRDYWVIKLDAAGTLQWEQTYGGASIDAAYAIQQTADGGYIVAGNSSSGNGDVGGNNGQADYWIVKLDNDGDIQWQKNYGGSSTDAAHSVITTADGGYMVAGYSGSNNGNLTGNFGSWDFWVVKLNNNGNIQWQRNYGGSNSEQARDVQQTADGGYVVTGASHSSDGDVGENNGISDAWALKLDVSGNIEWSTVHGGFSYDEPESIRQTVDGGYILGGLTRTPEGNSGGTAIDQAWVLRLDPSGFFVWEDRLGGAGIEQIFSIIQTTDNGFVFTGVSDIPSGDVSTFNGILDVWIVKLAALPGSIQGHVYLDNNENCVFDTGDDAMAGIVLTAVNSVTGEALYGYTNPVGQFLIETDTVPYVLSYSLPSPYYYQVACSPNDQVINLSSSAPNASHNFYLQSVISCPYLTVDIATPVLRRCFGSVYYLSYCNNGTTIAEDAYLELSLAPEISVVNASIPWSGVNGNTYTFPLGDIEALECNQFSVTVLVDCDSTFIGQTLCAEAHIYPDSNCLPVANWNGAELEATATCIGTDSVELKLRNVGSGDMQQAVPFLVIEDIIMRNGGPVQLNSQETATWVIPVDGLTQRITAQQPADHPYKTFTTAAVNLCNTTGIPFPGPVEDFYTAYPEDEEAPFVAIDCQEITAAFDPNDKTVHPSGATEQGFITATTDLTYKIRFQNTGNDTAFTVVIIDTLASHLDLTTLRPGASSHAYVLDVYGHGILKFTFPNILLPDSTVNEPASHGFVQFSIGQKEGNTAGTAIHNSANIYFDFNPPVATNTVLNTIGKIFVEDVATEEVDGKKVEVLAFPNPARDQMTFEIKALTNGFDLLLFDVHGRVVQQISSTGSTATLYRNSLPEGIYFFEIRSGTRAVSAGRLVFK